MTHRKILKLFESVGFDSALLRTSELEFDFKYRKYCEENLCGNYAQSSLCPPLCKGAEELKDEVLKHKFVLVLKSSHEISDLSDKAEIRAAQDKHNIATMKVISKIPEFSGALALCSSTDIEIPKSITAACLSAYCINVAVMAEKCGLSYAYKDNILSLFGFITLD